ncbi:MAG: hypothetical protein LBJ35_04565 [Spirochaetaceae bacterium]|jgi:hypothetical protein|nr:hypothetical protein [Spirochaetaceae bacterium]
MIGVENESSLHRSLKLAYAGEDGGIEVANGEYICDCVNTAGDIIEVQTGSFAPLRKKLPQLSRNYHVKIVYPIIEEKHIALYDNNNNLTHLRKSPKRGCKWDLFNALIYAPLLPLLPNLTVDLAIVDILEERKADGKGSWRRDGVSIRDKFLQNHKQTIVLCRLKDYLQFIPFKTNEPFTAALLADKSRVKPALARKTIYVLNRLELIEQIGKCGRSKLYRITRRRKARVKQHQ